MRHQVVADLALVLPVLDVLLDLLELLDNAQVRAAVTRALERGDRRRDSGIGIRAGGGGDAHGKGRVIAAAVLCVQDEAAVEQLGLVVGVFAVRADQVQDVLRGRALRVGHVQEHGRAVKVAALRLIGVRDNDRELGGQADALTHDVLDRRLVRVAVVGIQRERRAGELVHDVAARRAHDHILGEVVRQRALQTDDVLELLELAARRQFAAHEQIADLLEAEAVLALETVNEIIYVITPVGQAAFDRFALALVEDVAVHVAEVGRADQNAGAVRVSQAALDSVTGVQVRRELVMQAEAFAEFLQLFFFYKIRLNVHPAFPFLFPRRPSRRSGYFQNSDMNISYPIPANMSIYLGDIFCQKCDMMGFWRLLTLHERKTLFPFVQTFLCFAMQKC